jgi:hypothetical protein
MRRAWSEPSCRNCRTLSRRVLRACSSAALPPPVKFNRFWTWLQGGGCGLQVLLWQEWKGTIYGSKGLAPRLANGSEIQSTGRKKRGIWNNHSRFPVPLSCSKVKELAEGIAFPNAGYPNSFFHCALQSFKTVGSFCLHLFSNGIGITLNDVCIGDCVWHFNRVGICIIEPFKRSTGMHIEFKSVMA